MSTTFLSRYEPSLFSLSFLVGEEVLGKLPSPPFRLTVLGFARYHLRLPLDEPGTLHVLHGFGKIVTHSDFRRFWGPCTVALPGRCVIVNLGASILEGIVDPHPPAAAVAAMDRID